MVFSVTSPQNFVINKGLKWKSGTVEGMEKGEIGYVTTKDENILKRDAEANHATQLFNI